MARGGKREGAGRPSEHEEREKEKFFRAALEKSNDALVGSLPEAVEVLKIVALGEWQEMRYVKPSGRLRAQLLSVEECEDGAGEAVYLCTRAPDKQALLALIEHTRGRAAQTARVELDTQIVLQHQVPRPAPEPRGAPGWEGKYHKLLPEERAKA